MSSPPGRFTMTGLPRQMLLTLAYRIRQDHVDGAPDRVRTSRFDINAKLPELDDRNHEGTIGTMKGTIGTMKGLPVN